LKIIAVVPAVSRDDEVSIETGEDICRTPFSHGMIVNQR
jgi:hypothetical protein